MSYENRRTAKDVILAALSGEACSFQLIMYKLKVVGNTLSVQSTRTILMGLVQEGKVHWRTDGLFELKG